MKNPLQIIPFFIFGFLTGQEMPMEKVYFDFDQYTLQQSQKKTIVDFIQKTDTSKIASIKIYGYCDDRGDYQYNCNLSYNRVNTVRKILLSKGIKSSKINILEGKGLVPLNKDTVGNLKETRSRNRRVDIIIIEKRHSKNYINPNRTFTSIQDNHRKGDLVYLKSIYFAMGSSRLSTDSKRKLDQIILALQEQKRLKFEIRGHVCCTPNYYTDAIDRETQERNLSWNRAQNVYRYLISKKIDKNRMNYRGYGNQFPLGKADSLDRRVEFLILNI